MLWSPSRKVLLSSCVILACLLLVVALKPHLEEFVVQNQRENAPKVKIWISMSLCWNETTTHFGKEHYPYTAVTPLSVLLWKYFAPQANVLIQMIHNGQTEHSLEMITYERTLTKAGAHVEWVDVGDADCIVWSQLTRMLCFQSPLVHPEDICMTIDVNAFITSPNILNPIYNNPSKDAWIYQFHETAHIGGKKGECFNQNLITLRARAWQDMLLYHGVTDRVAWLKGRAEALVLDKGFTWFYDQWITTLSLLLSKICTVPKHSGLWKWPNLHFDPYHNDSATCWHGVGFTNCNMEDKVAYMGCHWYHFFPFQDLDQHILKFRQLTNNTIRVFYRSQYDMEYLKMEDNGLTKIEK